MVTNYLSGLYGFVRVLNNRRNKNISGDIHETDLADYLFWNIIECSKNDAIHNKIYSLIKK